jgi:protein-disulfide isomerase
MLRHPITPLDHIRGSASAQVALVEYGDYECWYCNAAELIIRRLMRTRGDGFQFVFRNFPRSDVHPKAMEAAIVAELAADLGTFWPIHDGLLEHQEALGMPLYEALFEAHGLPVGALGKALTHEEYPRRIRAHAEDAGRNGVNGTPTFFINNRRYEGAHEYEAILDALHAAGKHFFH